MTDDLARAEVVDLIERTTLKWKQNEDSNRPTRAEAIADALAAHQPAAGYSNEQICKGAKAFIDQYFPGMWGDDEEQDAEAIKAFRAALATLPATPSPRSITPSLFTAAEQRNKDFLMSRMQASSDPDYVNGDMHALVGMDGYKWTKAWLQHLAQVPGFDPSDEGLMIGWFCNAIMAGYDTAQRKFEVDATRPGGWKLVPLGASISLADCPIGLFISESGTLALKSEYGNNEGRIDAYIVSSGEFFWGAAPQTIASQRAQMVTPVEVAPSPPTEPTGGEG